MMVDPFNLFAAHILNANSKLSLLSGTILAAYLLKEENLTAAQAIDKIRKLRPGSIQTKTQENCVEAFEQYLKRGPDVDKQK